MQSILLNRESQPRRAFPKICPAPPPNWKPFTTKPRPVSLQDVVENPYRPHFTPNADFHNSQPSEPSQAHGDFCPFQR